MIVSFLIQFVLFAAVAVAIVAAVAVVVVFEYVQMGCYAMYYCYFHRRWNHNLPSLFLLLNLQMGCYYFYDLGMLLSYVVAYILFVYRRITVVHNVPFCVFFLFFVLCLLFVLLFVLFSLLFSVFFCLLILIFTIQKLNFTQQNCYYC